MTFLSKSRYLAGCTAYLENLGATMRRLLLLATVVVLINALRQHPRHITETQVPFPDGIDPAPDKISGEANRLKAQEPLEGTAHFLHMKSGEELRTRCGIVNTKINQLYGKRDFHEGLSGGFSCNACCIREESTVESSKRAGDQENADCEINANPATHDNDDDNNTGTPATKLLKICGNRSYVVLALTSAFEIVREGSRKDRQEDTTTVAQTTTSLPESSVQGSDNSAENSDPGSDEAHFADDTDAEASEEGIEEENTNNEEESHTKEGEPSRTLEQGRPPSYPISKEQIHSPSASRADQLPQTTTTAVPREVYHFPRGQTRATATPHVVSPTSPLPPVSKSAAILTDPPVKPSQELKPEPEKGAARKTSVEHANAQQGKDGASWERVEQRQENRGNKEVQSGSASEDKIGDEKGSDAAHEPSVEVQSNYEGFENQEEQKSDQNSENSIATVSKTKIEATEEQRDEENNKNENNPEETASISESKKVAVKKKQVEHNMKQEEADKTVAESEEGAINDASTESYDEEGEGEDYEPDESGQSSERTDPLSNKNITEEELEEPMDVAELAELGNSTSAEQEAEGDYEPKGSGIALKETNSVNHTKKNEDKEKNPSAGAERKDEKHIWKETVLSSKEKKANHAAPLSSIRGNTGEWHKKMIRTAEGPKPTATERITDKNKEHGAAGNDHKKSAISAEEDETSGSEEQAFESAEDTRTGPHGADDADGKPVENAAEAGHGSSDRENRIEKMNDHDVPVVEVDSRTKGRDIVIAYNPTYRKGSGVVRAGTSFLGLSTSSEL
ncbi:unnamed protein product [Haemonchus placei]|uniref:Uncharacterized protein n=1 Tax=Haemonchus placei TaxID=6290 RepID=A0A0N4WDL4_HAEPC|nr:unnamed protein product [Haemonchus placei]